MNQYIEPKPVNESKLRMDPALRELVELDHADHYYDQLHEADERRGDDE